MNSTVLKILKTIISVTAAFVGFTLIVIILSLIGILRLEVENSFINYFKKNTEIYKGMKLIDDKLGGTTPLDIIIKFPSTDLDQYVNIAKLLIKNNNEKKIIDLRVSNQVIITNE